MWTIVSFTQYLCKFRFMWGIKCMPHNLFSQLTFVYKFLQAAFSLCTIYVLLVERFNFLINFDTIFKIVTCLHNVYCFFYDNKSTLPSKFHTVLMETIKQTIFDIITTVQCFFYWKSLHARLNSHYKAYGYKKKKHKTIKAYRKSL